MKNKTNKESTSTTQTKSVEPMFEASLKNELEKIGSISFSIRYVVTRDGHRVSDKDYSSITDKYALDELKFWNKISKNHSWGEKVEIVQYDPKKHRVW